MIAASTIHANAFAVTSAASGAVTLTVWGTWSIRYGVPSLIELSRAQHVFPAASIVCFANPEARLWT